jgi:opacity protein-like surface antigen
MEVLSYIVLVLLSLVGYSAGAAGRAGKNTNLKPIIADLILVVFIWAGAIYSRLTYDFNKWLLILVWVGMAAVAGMVAVSLRKLSVKDESQGDERKDISSSIFRRLWQRWTGFSKRMGSFQSRVMLSLFFFVVVSPAAVLSKAFGDPLQIKRKKTLETYWSDRTQSSEELEDFRRQF